MTRILLFLISLCLGFKITHSQPVVDTSCWRFNYSGNIQLGEERRDFSKEPEFENTVLRKGNSAVSWQVKTDYSYIHNGEQVPKTSDRYKAAFVYKNYKDRSIIFKVSYLLPRDKQVFSDTLDLMDWTITNTAKKIDSFSCYKALCIFRGRAYAAWFCPDIPVSDGPWKFGGLPGLIVEIYDEEKGMHWKLKEIRHTNEEMPPRLSPVGSFSEFRRLFNKGFRELRAATEAKEKIDPSCSTCSEEQVTFRIDSIENLIDY